MKTKMIVVGCLMILALMTMASQPDKAQAGTSVHVGFNLGGGYMPVDVYTRHVHYRPPPDYYGADRWYRRPPPPPRGWYRHHGPPPEYYNEYRHPSHHRRHHWRGEHW